VGIRRSRSTIKRSSWPLGIANAISVLIGSAATAAESYGKQIDQLNQFNSVAALALANCLVAYCEACNVPFAATEGGYRRYFSGYLLLRQSLRIFGLLEPWERVMAVKNDSGDSRTSGIALQMPERLMTGYWPPPNRGCPPLRRVHVLWRLGQEIVVRRLQRNRPEDPDGAWRPGRDNDVPYLLRQRAHAMRHVPRHGSSIIGATTIDMSIGVVCCDTS
jgi:hypothetical protein